MGDFIKILASKSFFDFLELDQLLCRDGRLNGLIDREQVETQCSPTGWVCSCTGSNRLPGSSLLSQAIWSSVDA
jgi:hypothetical protein